MTIVLGRLLGLEFLPKLEEGNLWIRATLPPTISLQEGNSYVNEIVSSSVAQIQRLPSSSFGRNSRPGAERNRHQHEGRTRHRA